MDPIGISSGLLTLTAFAFQSSQKLYELVSSFENHGRNVRQLKGEVEALNGVLESLRQTLDLNGPDLSALELPVRRCGRACQEFTEVIEKCTARSKGPRTSFRDWFKISYMGKDIAGFTSLIAGYKATITIALCDANIRTSKVTANLLREYKAMIGYTTSDLEDILQDLNARIQDPNLVDNEDSGEYIAGKSGPEEERASIQQCLNICVQVSSHIDQVQSKSLSDVGVPSASNGSGVVVDKPRLARLITNETLQDCKRGLGLTSVELRARLQDAERRLANTLRRSKESEGGVQDHQRVEEDLESVQQCLSICAEAAEEAAKARVIVFEDVCSGDDVQQLILSTVGDLISAKRVTTGSRSAQWLGQMSDATVQTLSQNHNHRNATPDEQPQVVPGLRFENRHGTGRKLD